MSLRSSGLRIVHQRTAGETFQVLEKDLVPVGLGQIEGLQDLQRYARKHGALLRVERAVGGEDHLVARIELQPAFRRRRAPEGGGVGKKVLLEIIERALFEALAQGDVSLIDR